VFLRYEENEHVAHIEVPDWQAVLCVTQKRGIGAESMAFVPGQIETKAYCFDEASISAYATMAGDHNMLHHDVTAARASRFKGLIASGSHMSGVLMGFGATIVSRDHLAVGLEFTFRFERAIPASTDTVLSWTVTSVEPHAKLGGTMLMMEGAISSLNGQRYVSSTGRAVVWDRQPA
jgi:3-hydroxybutyryl-CoA dehydratase